MINIVLTKLMIRQQSQIISLSLSLVRFVYLSTNMGVYIDLLLLSMKSKK